MIKKKSKCVFILLILFLVACNSKGTSNSTILSGSQISAKIQKEECIFEKISPAKSEKQLIELSGDSPKIEEFSVNSETTIRVYWNQMSTDDFLLSIINKDPKLANDPANETVLESIVGPSSGCTDLTLTAGEYEIAIKNTNSNWSVLIENIQYK